MVTVSCFGLERILFEVPWKVQNTAVASYNRGGIYLDCISYCIDALSGCPIVYKQVMHIIYIIILLLYNILNI